MDWTRPHTPRGWGPAWGGPGATHPPRWWPAKIRWKILGVGLEAGKNPGMGLGTVMGTITGTVIVKVWCEGLEYLGRAGTWVGKVLGWGPAGVDHVH